MDKLNYALCEQNEGLYIVEENDTLSSLADKFNTTENLLIIDNCLTKEVEKGDYLYVKSYDKVISVKIGEDVDSISQKYNITKEEILRINRITYVYPTQKLVINEKDKF